MIENNINVRLDHFDGPLGLLLHLIQREEMSIRDLNLNRLTAEYLDYLNKLQNLNFDIAGEYLYMAATLLHIKSQNCVDEGEEERKLLKNEDGEPMITKTQLIQKLEELQRFQKMGEKFWEKLPRRDEHIFVKPKVDRKAIQNSILSPMDLEALTNSMVDLIRREKRKYTVVKRDRLSIKEKLKSLKERLELGSQTTLMSLVEQEKGRDDVVITFISLLELARLSKLSIFQNEDRGEIYVDVINKLDDFDVETADGFEPEEENTSISTDDIENAAKALEAAMDEVTQADTTPDEEETLH